MRTNAMTEEYEEAELFGRPVLFTNSRLDRATVPQGWYCYDLRGGGDDPGEPATLEESVQIDHAGSILSPEPFIFEEGKDYLPIEDELGFLDGGITLKEFCKLYGLEPPKQNCIPHPASSDEAGLFYSQTPEQDEKMGCIGHVRIDFGSSGKEFWHTWWPRGPEELNSPGFKSELGEVVDKLRESVLKDLPSMRSYCHANGGAIDGGICTQNYGYTVETERYVYRLRCNPIAGDYQAYLSCFDKQAQELSQDSPVVGRVSFASGERIEYTDPAEYLKAIREELPYHATTGFHFDTLTSDPEVRKAADDALYNMYGEENPRPLEDYLEQPNTGMTIGGM